MGRFYLKGVIINEPEKRIFKTGAISKTILVEEKADGKRPITYLHKVEFNGKYAYQLPENIKLKGVEVAIIGSLTAPESDKGIFEHLKGESIMVIQYPRFEEELPTDVHTGAMPLEDVDNDLPF